LSRASHLFTPEAVAEQAELVVRAREVRVLDLPTPIHLFDDPRQPLGRHVRSLDVEVRQEGDADRGLTGREAGQIHPRLADRGIGGRAPIAPAEQHQQQGEENQQKAFAGHAVRRLAQVAKRSKVRSAITRRP